MFRRICAEKGVGSRLYVRLNLVVLLALSLGSRGRVFPGFKAGWWLVVAWPLASGVESSLRLELRGRVFPGIGVGIQTGRAPVG